MRELSNFVKLTNYFLKINPCFNGILGYISTQNYLIIKNFINSWHGPINHRLLIALIQSKNMEY